MTLRVIVVEYDCSDEHTRVWVAREVDEPYEGEGFVVAPGSIQVRAFRFIDSVPVQIANRLAAWLNARDGQ